MHLSLEADKDISMSQRQFSEKSISHTTHLSRRHFLQATSTGMAGAFLTTVPGFADNRALTERPKVAVILTVCHFRSHAHVILENFLEQYLFNGKKTDSGVDVVSFYADQSPGGDMLPGISKEYGIPIYKSIREALCVGGKELAVDAVLSIGEHGNYPVNDLGQRKYPRKRFFDEAVAVMKQSNRFVPFFNDKHLSYRWDWAKEMYDTTQKHGIPFMAGSSVPLAQRTPPLEFSRDVEIEEAVSIHGGGVEAYDFHALEVLQSMVESRQGGETGISRVEFLDRDALFQALDSGRISRKLIDAAMDAEFARTGSSAEKVSLEKTSQPHGILLEYRSGLKATILKVGSDGTRWNFACRLKNEAGIKATSFYVGPWNNRNLFKALSHSIQHHFKHGTAPYPVERTLLVTGVLDSAMHSRKQAGKSLKTPHLEFAYAPRDFRAMREMGASWNIITEETPEPEGIHSSD